jgi:hypothetical protein
MERDGRQEPVLSRRPSWACVQEAVPSEGHTVHDVITSIEHVTPAWLTGILRQRGYLGAAMVQALSVTRVHTIQPRSISYFLTVEYSSPLADAPTHLYLKVPKPDADPVLVAVEGEREVRLYQALALSRRELPVIPCYDAVYHSDQRAYHLLLDDLSATHDQPSWHLTIADHYITQTVDCLAQFHAYWWEHPLLNHGLSALPTKAGLQDEIRWLQASFPAFAQALGDQLPAEDRHVCDMVLAALPSLWERRTEIQGQTLVHGDAHFWNFLYPHNPHEHRTYMLDWQTYHVSPGTNDLAYTIVLRYPHRTPINERDLVKRYHEGLLAHGVTTYSWETCWQDYRRSAAEQFLVPLRWWATDGLFVERALRGFRDLACDETLHV